MVLVKVGSHTYLNLDMAAQIEERPKSYIVTLCDWSGRRVEVSKKGPHSLLIRGFISAAQSSPAGTVLDDIEEE